jgi:hypothetical protein
VRDGIYGNSNSWIGDSLNSFVGIRFGAIGLPVGQIAFGRDNTGSFFDRAAGPYTIQYTMVPNPDAATPDALWLTIGTLTQGGNDAGLFSGSRRKALNFPPVLATGVRVVTPGSSFANGAAIDELELSTFAPAPLARRGTGGTMDAARNIALAANGGAAFGKDEILGGSLAIHRIPHLNDGSYGNSNSWIGDSKDSFAGVSFASPQTIERVAFGRDNTGDVQDRADGYYLLQYTTVAKPDASTLDLSWADIGPVFIDAAVADRARRHEFSFAPVAGATGLRVIVPGNGINSGRAIDELEVYAVPEPGGAVLALGAVALLGRRRAGKRDRFASESSKFWSSCSR